jgi:hypothetical protein
MGIIGGLVAFFLTTAITVMLYDAMPLLPWVWRIVLYLGLASLPALAFLSISRNSHASKSARVMGSVAVAVLVIFVAGDVTGFLRIYPHNEHFYIAPAVPH